MPLIKSAIKRMHQTEKRRKRLLPVRSYMKTMMKKVVDLTHSKKHADAEKILPEVYKAIDMAAKKNIIHKRNADRKKSKMARLVAAK